MLTFQAYVWESWQIDIITTSFPALHCSLNFPGIDDAIHNKKREVGHRANNSPLIRIYLKMRYVFTSYLKHSRGFNYFDLRR